MKRRVPRVAAVIEQHLGRLMLAANRRELLGSWVCLAEMDTKSALSLVKLLHVSSPLMRRPFRWGNFRAVATTIVGSALAASSAP